MTCCFIGCMLLWLLVVLFVCLFVCLFVLFCLLACLSVCLFLSFAELPVNLIHTARIRPLINIHKFRQDGRYRQPRFRMPAHCVFDVPLAAYDFAEDLRTFLAALTWFRKRAVALLPGDVVLNARSLYIIGYSRPTKVVLHRAKHSCPVDPRVTLRRDLYATPRQLSI